MHRHNTIADINWHVRRQISPNGELCIVLTPDQKKEKKTSLLMRTCATESVMVG